MTKIEGVRTFAQCTLHLETAVSGAEPIEARNLTLVPFALDVTFLYDFDIALWEVRVRVFGSPVLKNGSRGKSTRSVMFHEDNLDEAPQWVRDYVRAHFPPALPALPALEAIEA